MTQGGDWHRLGRAILHDRARHWHTRADFARHAGISERLLDDLEGGRRSNYSDDTFAAIESALGWRMGTCMRVVEGGEVFREFDPELARIMSAWPYISQESREILADVAERRARR